MTKIHRFLPNALIKSRKEFTRNVGNATKTVTSNRDKLQQEYDVIVVGAGNEYLDTWRAII